MALKKIFRRVGKRIMVFTVDGSKLSKTAHKASSINRKHLRSIASARTSLSNKRIGAIRTVRQAKMKYRKANDLLDHLESIAISRNAKTDGISRAMRLSREGQKSKVLRPKSLNKLFRKQMVKQHPTKSAIVQDLEDPSMTWNKENIINREVDRRLDNLDSYKKLRKQSRADFKYRIKNQRISEDIKSKVLPSGVTAQAVVLKNKVVKTSKDTHDLVGQGLHMSIKERAKLSIHLSQKKLTPETFLVQTSKRDYKVMERLDPVFRTNSDVLEKRIDKLKSSLIKNKVSPHDVRGENVGYKGNKLKSIDTGEFIGDTGRFRTDPITGLRSEIKTKTYIGNLKRLNKFIIKSNKDRKK
jgi:hypothetical protein